MALIARRGATSTVWKRLASRFGMTNLATLAVYRFSMHWQRYLPKLKAIILLIIIVS